MDTILVVDDIADNVKLLQYHLEDEGYRVLTASNGAEAISMTELHRPDVILLDIMMPVLDGLEACKRLKANEALSQIPVILVSAANENEYMVRGLDSGAIDYIAKPINTTAVSARVRSALRHKKHEDSIRALNTELEKERDVAQAALRARSSFLATMSHEIRTPITAIMGLSEILINTDELSPFDNAQAAQTIFGNSQYLLEIINNILDLSKSESGNLEIEVIECCLFKILRDVEMVVNLKAVEKGLLFYIDIEYPLPEKVLTDPTRLKQVLINLVNNALKFTENGSVKLAVHCNRQTNELIFAISDTGIGMSETELERLFQPFQQANNSITRRFGGSGLGLTISKDIMDRLGGTITVQSQPELGSTFQVTVPFDPLENIAWLDHNPFVTSQSTDIKSQRFSGKVLLVEDEPINQKLIQHNLELFGVDVEVASDGETGLVRGSSNAFDLIFLDMKLPKLDGMSVMSALKEKGIRTPVVALTASQEKKDLNGMLQSGCVDYLPKPFARCELGECLRRFLRGNIPSETSETSPTDQATFDDRYADLIVGYIEKLTVRLQDLEQAFSRRDWDALRHSSHNLVGAGLFGFQQISFLAKLMEDQSIRHDDEACQELLQRLQKEVEKAQSNSFPR